VLPPRYSEPCLYVFVFILRIRYNPLHHVGISLANAQRVVHPNTGEEYPYLHIWAQRARLCVGVDDADAWPRGTTTSKCDAANINTYSNRSLLTCARLEGSTKTRSHQPRECVARVASSNIIPRHSLLASCKSYTSRQRQKEQINCAKNRRESCA